MMGKREVDQWLEFWEKGWPMIRRKGEGGRRLEVGEVRPVTGDRKKGPTMVWWNGGR